MYDLDSLLNGIRFVESSNRYDALGPVTKKGDRAYGAYQVMGNNIPSWTKEVLGSSLTPAQFLQNRDAQETVARSKIGSYLEKYGRPEDAVSMWFSGRPMAQAGNASDGYNTVPSYVQKVLSHAKPEGPMQFAPTHQANPMANDGINAIQTAMGGSAPEPTPQPFSMNLGQAERNPFANSGLGGLAVALMSIDNPQGAAAMAASQRDRAKQTSWQFRGFTQNGKGMTFVGPDGQVRIEPTPEAYQGPKEQNAPSQIQMLDMMTPERMAKWKELHPQEGPSKLTGDYTPEELPVIEQLAEVYKGDKSALAKFDREDRAKVLKYLKDQGVTGGQIKAGQAEQMGNVAEAREYGKQASRIKTFGAMFEGAAELALEASQQFPRSDWKMWNQIANTAADQLGNPAYAAFNTANYSLANDYARTMALTGTPSVTAFKEAREMLSNADSPEAYAKKVEWLQKEVRRANEKISQNKAGFVKEVTGEKPEQAQEAPKQPSGPAPRVSTREEYDRLPSGATYIDPNGVERKKR